MPHAEFSGNDRYRVIRRLGVGGMGVVYEAEDRDRGQRVALKSIQTADSDLMYRLKREFRLLADLSHPNLVELYDLFADERGCFYTMELVRGVDFVRYCLGPTANVVPGSGSPDADTQLGGAAPKRRPGAGGDWTPVPRRPLVCDERRFRDALQQLALGLHALHDSGKVHRDIKPSNVLVDPEGRVVLLDFGLVTDIGLRRSEQSLLGQVIGTAEYMAPEQAGSDEEPTPAVDWYSVGVMMYEAMTGRLPFTGDSMDMLYEKIRRAPPPPRAIVPDAPADLDQLCEELLTRDPHKRPVGAEVLRRLGIDVGDEPPRTRTKSRITQWAPFAGREAELVGLRESFGRVEAGAAAIVWITGPSGIGKTELVRAFFDRVREDRGDLVVLEGRCYQREAVPYKAMDALVDNLSRLWLQLAEDEARGLVPRHAALLPKLFPVLGRVPVVATARGRRAPPGAQEVRTRAFGALREVLQRLGDRRPLAMFIDDMQWVDSDTVTLLADLMRPPDPPACLLVLCSRDATDDVGELDGSSDLASMPGFPTPRGFGLERDELGDAGPLQDLFRGFGETATRLTLGRLTDEESIALAAKLLGSHAGRHAVRVAEESHGNPFFLGELARYVQVVQPGDVATVRLDEVVGHRIARLDESTRRLLEVVCVAGEPLSRRVAGTAAELSSDELTSELRLLGTSQLARSPGGEGDRVEPYHNRFREAVLAGLSPTERAAHHRALALALERWGEGTTEQLARHWFGAGDAERAADYAHRAAQEAVETLDFDRAARHYQMTLAVGAHDAATQRDLLTRLGEAQANSGRPLDAANAFLAASRAAEAGHRLELRRRAADELLGGGYREQGLEVMQEVLREIDSKLPGSPRRALVSVLWRRFRLRLRGLDFTERDESQLAPDDLTRVDVYWSVAHGLSIVDPIIGMEFASRHLLAALRLGEPVRLARAVALEAALRAAQGSGRAPALLARSDELNERSKNDPLAQAVNLWAHGAMEYFSHNDWRSSLEHFQRAEVTLRTTQQAAGWENDNCQIYICFNLMYLGKLRELSKLVPGLIREAQRRGDRFFDVSLRTRLGIVHLAADDPTRSAAMVDEALRRWGSPDAFQVQHFYGMHTACEAALYVGEPDAAWQRFAHDYPPLKRSLLLRVPIVAAEVEWLRARIAAARGDATELRRAHRRLRRLPIPLGPNLARLTGAAIAIGRGDEDAAVRSLRAVVERLSAAETRLYLHPARHWLGELIGGDEGAALCDRALERLTKQGVLRPDRMIRTLVPLPAS